MRKWCKCTLAYESQAVAFCVKWKGMWMMKTYYSVNDLENIIFEVAMEWQVPIDDDTAVVPMEHSGVSDGYIMENKQGKLSHIQSVIMQVCSHDGENDKGIYHMRITHNSDEKSLELECFDQNENKLEKFFLKEYEDDHHNEYKNFFYMLSAK